MNKTSSLSKTFSILTLLCLTLSMLYPQPLWGITPALLDYHDENSVYVVLENEIPDLNINTLTLISAGWDNLVADINGEWIFRFPRSLATLPTLVREKLLLERLHNSISMPVPHYQYFGINTAFVGYRKIIGEELTEEIYLSLPDKIRQEIAESLALFLSQLHNAVTVDEAHQWGYKDYSLSLEWIEYSLLGTLESCEIERIIREALAYAKQNSCGTKKIVFLHNDLHGGNLAFDILTQQVTGVFDFSDAVIGDYTIDFGKLFCIHEDLAFRACEAYAKLNDVDNPFVPAAADYILRRAVYLLHNRESGNMQHQKSLLHMLQEFIPVWDGLQKTFNCSKRSFLIVPDSL